MNPPIVQTDGPVLLVGGGDSAATGLKALAERADRCVGADSGAEALLALGVLPDAVIGDLDSISEAALARLPRARVHHIAEQDSTDFDKCLRNISAPLIWASGFLGQRTDHELAALTVLTRRCDRRCILVGARDVVALVPPRLALELEPGDRFSLYPMGPVRGWSTGLRWPIDGIDFAPGLRGGTSNEVGDGPVRLEMEAPYMLVILPVRRLRSLERALLCAPDAWPAPD